MQLEKQIERYSVGILVLLIVLSPMNNQAPAQEWRTWDGNTGNKEYYPRGIAFSHDGKNMYICGNYWNGQVQQFKLRNAWGISTSAGEVNAGRSEVAFARSFSTYGPRYEEHVRVSDSVYGNFEGNSNTKRLRGVGVGSTGESLYVLGYYDRQIIRYPMTTSHYVTDIGVATQFNYDRMYWSGVGLVSSFYYYVGFASGSYWYGGNPEQWRGGSGSPGFAEGDATGLYVRPDGLKFFITGSESDRVYEYNISTSTPWSVDNDYYHKVGGVGDFYSDIGVDVKSRNNVGLGTTFAYLHHLEKEVRGLTFKPDGRRMYITGTQSRSVWQFELAEPWNVGTANTGQDPKFYMRDGGGSGGTGFSTVGIAKSLQLDTYWNNDVASGRTLEYQPYDVEFDITGRLMYVLGVGSDRPFVFELDTPWEIDTARYFKQSLTTRFDQGSPGITTVEANPYGMAWSRDGGHLYVTGNNGYVYDFENNLAWNTDYETDYSIQPGYGNSQYYIVPGSNQLAFPSGIATVTDVQYNPDMDKMYVVGTSNSTGSQMIQYGTGTSLGRGDYQASLAFGRVAIGQSYYFNRYLNGDTVRGSAFSTDGKYFYLLGHNQDRVFKFELNKPWNIDTVKVGIATTTQAGQPGISSVYIGGIEATGLGLNFNHDGTRMYIVGNNHYVYQWNIPESNRWDISSATYNTAFYVHSNSEGTSPQTVAFDTSGKRMYVATHSNAWVRQYYLDNPWEVNTAQRAENMLINASAASPQSFKWNSDGTRLFILGDSRNEVFQYDLQVPYDIAKSLELVASSNTGVGTTGFNISDADASATGLAFNANGTKMYVVGLGSTAITQYGLTTAFNVASAAWEKKVDLYPSEWYPEEIDFNSDGTKMYVLGRKFGSIIEYNLGTAYDIETADLGNVGFASTAISYLNIDFASASAGVAITANNSDFVTASLASGGGSWNRSAVGISSYGAPFTMEFRCRANSSGTSNKMAGLTTTTGTDLSYTSASHVLYPYAHSGGLGIYQKSTQVWSGGKNFNNDDFFRISYGVDGYVRYFASQVEVYREFVGYGQSYFPALFFNTTGGQFDDIRITTTGFTTSTDGYGNSYDLYQKGDNALRGFHISRDGMNLNSVGTQNDRIYRHVLRVSDRVGSATTVGINTFNGATPDGYGSLSGLEGTPRGIGFNTDGTRVYVVGDNNRFYQYYSHVTYQPLNWTEEGYYFGLYESSTPNEIKFSDDGKVMYMLDADWSMYTFPLERAWDLQSVNWNDMDKRRFAEGSNPHFRTAPYTFTLKHKTDDVLYVTDQRGQTNQYPANKGWIVPTDDQVQHVGFASEGSIMYVTGISSGAITRYDLTEPYDIESARRSPDGQTFFTRSENQKYAYRTRDKYNPRYANSYGQHAIWRETEHTSLTFNYDGSKMYVLGDTTDTVYQYNLSEPYNTQKGVSIGGTFYVGYQEIQAQAIDFKTDGTKMYLVGLSSDKLFQYNLAQPWEIVSASYDGDNTPTTSPAINYFAQSLILEDNQPREFIFNYNGTQGYMIGTQRNTVYTYNFSTPWDVSTLSVSAGATFTVVDYERASEGLFFKPDGTEMYVVGYGTTASVFSGLGSTAVSAGIATTMGNRPGHVHQFTLASPWDVTTAGYTTSRYVGDEENQPLQVTFNPTGTKMVIVGKQRDRLQQYDLTTPWNVDTAAYEPFFNNNYNSYQGSSDGEPNSVAFSTSGTDLYILERNNGQLRQYELSNPFQVRNLETAPRAFAWKPDGTKIYIVGSDYDRVFQYSVSTPWDVGTLVYDDKYFYVGEHQSTPTGIHFKPDGTELYIMGHSGNWLSKWDLSTAWDVSTAKNENETGSGFWASQIGIASTAYNVGNNRGSSPYGLGFSTTGTRFWWLAGEGGSPGASNLFENETQRSYGLTSAYYNAKYDNYDMFPQVGRNQRVDNSDNRKRFHMRHMYPNTPEFVGFGSNGKIMYVLNSFDDDIHQYHLAAPYDMFNWTEQPMDIGFSTDGRQMYVLGQDTKKIYQINVGLGSQGYDIVHSQFNYDWLEIDRQLENDPHTFAFKPDGTKVYVWGGQRRRVFEYDLSTPWQISSAGLGTTSYYTGDYSSAEGYGLRFHPDGTSMYMADYGNYDFYQWNLRTPWDLGTIGFRTEYAVSNPRYHFRSVNQQVRPRGLGFSTYGDKMFFIDAQNSGQVVSFNLDTTWDISAVGVGTTFFFVGNVETTPTMLGFSTDGTKMFVAGHSRALLQQYDMGNQATAPGISSAWNVGIATTALWHGRKWETNSPGMTGIGRSFDLTGPSIAGTFSLSPWETSPTSLWFDPDGTRMWVVGNQANYVREFRFNVGAWDLRWSNNANCLAVGSTVWTTNRPFYGHEANSSVTDFQWKPDGTRFWTLSNNTKRIHQWNVKSPWRMEDAQIETDFRTSAGTASSSRQLAAANNLQSFLWNEDGTKLYVSENGNGYIYIYDAPNPYDITDLQEHYRYSNFYVGNEEYYVRGMAFSTEGRKFFTVGNQDNWYVTQYELPTGWEFARRGISENSHALAIHTEGTKMWFAGEFRDQIYQHEVNPAWQVGSKRYYDSNNYATELPTGVSTDFTVIGRGITRVKTGIQSSIYVGQDSQTPYGVSLAAGAAEGQRFFTLNYGNAGWPDVLQYNVLNRWDFDGISIGASFKQVGLFAEPAVGFITETNPIGMTFRRDGTQMYIAGRDQDRVFQYYLGAAWNINTIYGDDFLGIGTTSISYRSRTGTNQLNCVGFSSDGYKAFIGAGAWIWQYDLFVAWDLRSGTYRKKQVHLDRFDIGTVGEIRFNDTGRVMYVMDLSSDRIHYFELHVPYEITTLYRPDPTEAQFYVGDDENEPYGFDISQDGKHLVISGNQRDRVIKYDLRSPWETRIAGGSDIRHMKWKYDGSKLFILNQELERIESFTTPSDQKWNLERAGFDTGNHMTIGGPVHNNMRRQIWEDYNGLSYHVPESLAFSADGNKGFAATKYGGSESQEVSIRQVALGVTNKFSTGIYTGAMYGLSGVWHDRYHSAVVGMDTNIGINTGASNTGNTNISFDGPRFVDSSPQSVAFSTDGTKMFFLGLNNDKVYTYNLATPWNVGSATTVGVAVSFFVGQEESNPRSLKFNYNGSRMYVFGEASDRVHQYNLTAGNYLVGGGSTVGYAGSAYLNYGNVLGENNAYGMTFSPDGFKLYTVGTDNDRIYQYNLATAWDIATIQNENDGVGLGTTSFYLGHEESDPRACEWSPDGLKLFVLGTSSRLHGGRRIHEYDATVAFAVTSLRYSGNRTNDLNGYSSGLNDFYWHPDGDRVYFADTGSSGAIMEYRTTVNWSVKSYHSKDIESIGFGSEGTKLYTLSREPNAVYEWNLSTPYEVGYGVTPSGNRFVHSPDWTGKSFYFGFYEGTPRGLGFSTNGEYMYVSGSNQRIYQFTLEDNWNLSTRLSGVGHTLITQFNTTPGSYISGLNFKPDGTKVYFVKYESDIIEEHTLSTPWDISSADLTMGSTVGLGTTAFWGDGVTGISTIENTPTALAFSYDGSKMYVLGHQQDTIYQYTLSTPWDINTSGSAGAFTTSFYVGYFTPDPWTLGFSTEGNYMYVSGSNRDRVYQIKLTEAWNVGSATTAVGWSTHMGAQDNSWIGIAMSSRGTSFFGFGEQNDRVYEFALPNEWEIKTAFDQVKSIGISSTGDKFYLSGISTVGQFGLKVGLSTLGIDSTGILEYNMETPWDLSSINGWYENYEHKMFSTRSSDTPDDFQFSNDGMNLYVLNWQQGYVHKLGLQTAWNISNLVPQVNPTTMDSRFDLSLGGHSQRAFAFSHDGRHLARVDTNYDIWDYELSGPHIIENTGDDFGAFYFKEDGLTCWVTDRSWGNIRKFDLTESYNLRTGIYTGHYFYYGNVSDGFALDFTPDGTKFFMGQNEYVSEFTMTTPWDVRTAIKPWNSWSRANVGENGLLDVHWKPDGSKYYVLGVNSVYEYVVPEPWNISGPKDHVDQYFQYTSEIPAGGGNAKNVTVGAGGSMLYIVGWSSTRQYKINHNSSGRTFNKDTIIRIDNNTTGVFIGSEGTKMYTVGAERDYAYQFSLTTPYDVGTSSYEKKSFYLGQYASEPQEIRLSSDGSKMYILDNNNNRIYQFTLRTPWDIETAEYYGSNYYVTPFIENTVTGFDFKPDGTKMFIVGHDRDAIFEYDLSTPWEVSTAGINTSDRFVPVTGGFEVGVGKSFSFQSRESQPHGVAFSTDGSYAYVIGAERDFVRGYYMSTPWNVSTASIGSTLNQTKFIGELETSPTGIHFGIGGTTMYIVGTSSHRVHQYNMSTPWNIGVATLTSNRKYSGRFDRQLFSDGGLGVYQQESTSASAIGFNTTGTRFYMMGFQNDNIYQYELSRPWDLQSVIGIGTTALNEGVSQGEGLVRHYVPNVRERGTFNDSGRFGQQYGIGFRTDGGRLFTVGIASISQYDLYATWRITNIGEISATGMAFKPDGTKIFVLGTNERRVYTFTLTNPWDLVTASIASTSTNSFFIGTVFSETNPRDLKFKPDGTSMFLTGNERDVIYQYDLTTPWDVSTAGIAATMSTRTKLENQSSPFGLGFSTDGKKFFYTQNDNEHIYERRLFESWDFRDVNEDRPTASYMRADGTRLFWTGRTTATVFSIDLSKPFDLTSADANGKSFSVGTEEAQPSGLEFSPDGYRMYIVGTRRNTVFSYELGEAWNVETAKYLGENIDLSMKDPIVNSIHVSTDGTKLFATGTHKGRVIPYDLT
jgi:DNA-binding beta-propeller fold protein YncE